MICLALKTSSSHDSDYSTVKLMGRKANNHLAQLDLRENPNTSSGSVPPIPHLGQGFEYPVR
jgi:hypothetical protein